jgi:hypothetical protein
VRHGFWLYAIRFILATAAGLEVRSDSRGISPFCDRCLICFYGRLPAATGYFFFADLPALMFVLIFMAPLLFVIDVTSVLGDSYLA